MKFSGAEASEAHPYDLCIIGSGPAGFTLALELRNSGLRICILESGGDVVSSDLDDLKKVDTDGPAIRPDSRERVLGGSSQTWSGYMAPLDPIDIESRPGLHDGWPIDHDELYNALDERGYRYSLPRRESFQYPIKGKSEHGLPAFQALDRKIFQVQPRPLRYAKTFGYTFLPTGFDIFLNATVLRFDVEQSAGSEKVTEAIIADLDGSVHRIKAAVFVVAASAIESVRLLLNSSLGNEHDQVGRYFMNHPKGYVGSVFFNHPLPVSHEVFEQNRGAIRSYIGLHLDASLQRREGLLNPYIRLEVTKDDRDFEKAKLLSRAFRLTFKALGSGDVRATLKSGLAMVGNLSGLGQLVSRAVTRLGMSADGPVGAARMRCFMEMEPSAENRVVLGDSRDRYGMLLPRVSQHVSELALASVEKLVQQISLEFAATNLGTVRPHSEPIAATLTVDSSHHLGGARMGRDAASSVVDPSLRVHGVDNLYVAGGAVFPTGGSANPTLTVIGLSIRLAETLKRRFNVTPGMPKPDATGSGVLIVGAGRRVAEDVVPAVESLSPEAFLSGIHATRRKVVFGLDRAHEVQPMQGLSEEVISASAILYIAVPSAELKSVLTHFRRFDCRHLTLIVDTPAVPSSDVDNMYANFAGVLLAEDSFFLPWLDLLKLENIDRAVFDRSAFRYHAAALGRAVANPDNSNRSRIASFSGKRDDVTISYDAGLLAEVKGPRNYDEGRIDFHNADGRIISSHARDGVDQIRPMIAGHLCTGFALGEKAVFLSEIESRLLGKFTGGDTIVSRMLDIKRVGLLRLLSQAQREQRGYTLQEGLEDNYARW